MAMHIKPKVADAGAEERSSVSVNMVGNIIQSNKLIRIAVIPGINRKAIPHAKNTNLDATNTSILICI